MSKIEVLAKNKSMQTQYTDIWANDTYLFMYEQSILMREFSFK